VIGYKNLKIEGKSKVKLNRIERTLIMKIYSDKSTVLQITLEFTTNKLPE